MSDLNMRSTIADEGHNDFWLREHASREMARIVESISDTYFQTMHTLASSGAMSPLMEKSIALRAEAGYSQTGITAAGSLIGAGIGSFIPGLGTVGGSILGSLAGGAVGNYTSGMMKLDAERMAILGQAQPISAAIGSSYGVPGSQVFSQFQAMGMPTNPALQLSTPKRCGPSAEVAEETLTPLLHNSSTCST